MRVSGIHSLWALCALGAMPLATPALGGTVDRKVAATATGDVLISSVSGSIDVRGWDRNEVQVTGRIDEDVERVDVETSGGRTVIKVILPRGRSNGGDLQVHLVARRTPERDANAAVHGLHHVASEAAALRGDANGTGQGGNGRC